AVFQILNDQSIQGSGLFDNAGLLIKTAGTGTTTFAAAISFSNNGGTVDVESGTLSFAGDYTQNSGDTILAAGATLAAGGTVNIYDASSLTVVTTEGNAPPPPGAARPNSKGSQPLAESEEAILSTAPDSPNAEAFWQS